MGHIMIDKDMARKIAEEIISVQPMDPELFKKLTDNSMSKEELIANGYKPVSSLGLMWTKEDK